MPEEFLVTKEIERNFRNDWLFEMIDIYNTLVMKIGPKSIHY